MGALGLVLLPTGAYTDVCHICILVHFPCIGCGSLNYWLCNLARMFCARDDLMSMHVLIYAYTYIYMYNIKKQCVTVINIF